MMLNSISNLASAYLESARLIDSDSLAYALSTGKCELLVRDLVAAKLDMSFDSNKLSFVAREWKKHDLTIFVDDQPTTIIEGKAWIHADALSSNKLHGGKKPMLLEMMKDVEKIKQTRNLFPRVQGFLTTLLVTCDSLGRDFGKNNPVTYDYYHRNKIKQFGSRDTMIDNSNKTFTSFISERFPDCQAKNLKYFESDYRDMYVRADLFIIEIKG